MKIALGLEYDGRDYYGWQLQEGVASVQGVLEAALEKVAVCPVRVHCAGRTDTGVHASLQVVHFDCAAVRPTTAWVRGTNAHLPDSVAVLWAKQVGEDFHARFCATGRHYRYVLINRPVRSALQAGRAGWFHRPLDVEKMQQAARHLVGTYDFTSFRAAACQASGPVRSLSRACVRREGEKVIFEFSANAFLHHMVRNMVGALVHVGKGGADPAWIAELIALRDRSRAAPTFSPAGLTLCGVDYPEHFALPWTHDSEAGR